jgi:predicted porin
MKKLAPIAAAVLACGAAHAQTSSVTVFGLLDVSIARFGGDAPSVTGVMTDGYQSSRIGFRGVEDLGGGLSAGFWLEAAVNPDTGTGGASNVNNQALAPVTVDPTATAAVTVGASGVRPGQQGLTFARRSTLSLSSDVAGELRLGRDYVPGFNNLSSFHPFGTNGVGSAGILFYPVPSGARVTNVRASNSVGYFLPKNLGGFYGQAMYALGENASTAPNPDDGKVVGARFGYAAGGFDVAYGYTKTKAAAVGDFTQRNIGASYDLKVVKLFALYGENKVGASTTKPWNVGAHVPFGPGVFRVAYGKVKATRVGNDATQWTLGYVHNLSKRTALYTNYSVVDNQGTGTAFDVGSGVNKPGGESKGYEFGIRHAF